MLDRAHVSSITYHCNGDIQNKRPTRRASELSARLSAWTAPSQLCGLVEDGPIVAMQNSPSAACVAGNAGGIVWQETQRSDHAGSLDTKLLGVPHEPAEV